MDTSIEYISAGMIMMLVLGVTGMYTNNMVNEKISNINQITGIKVSDRIIDSMLLSPGTPSDWDSYVYSPQSIGFANENAIKPYQLDRDKVNRLSNTSQSYIPPYEVRDLLGLAKNYLFTLEIYPIYNISIENLTSETFRVKVTNQWNVPVPSVNIIGAYLNIAGLNSTDLISFRNGDLSNAVYEHNTTDSSGQTILYFLGSGSRNTLLVMAEQLNVKSITVWPQTPECLITYIESTMGIGKDVVVEVVTRSIEIDGLNYFCKILVWWV